MSVKHEHSEDSLAFGKYYVIVAAYPKDERYLLGTLWIREIHNIEGVISKKAPGLPHFVVIDSLGFDGCNPPVMIELGDDPYSSKGIRAFCSDKASAMDVRSALGFAAVVYMHAMSFGSEC
jgi:hypothetical protein